MKRNRYAELHAHSAFTFLEGADSPQALTEAAVEVGLSALAVLDVDGLYSAVRTAQAGKAFSLPIVHGSALTLDKDVFPELNRSEQEEHRFRLPVLAAGQQGYHDLSALISKHFLDHVGRRKGAFTLEELAAAQQRGRAHWMVLTGSSHGPLREAMEVGGIPAARNVLSQLVNIFGKNKVAVESALAPHTEKEVADYLAALAKEFGLPLVATGAAHLATPRSQPLADVLTAIRLNQPLEKVEGHLPAWRSFLRSAEEMWNLHRYHPHAVGTAAELGESFAFDLNLVDPGLPRFQVPQGHNEDTWLRHQTEKGAKRYYGSATHNPKAWKQLDHELQIISDLGFSGYFLIVKDIVDYCASQNILCQGRGSAANSAVCYSLGITAVDAVEHKMLFERFLSPGRSQAPDIDLDIEAKRREEVIQYVYNRYGRGNAAMVANVITYRPKSAIRDAARAFGYGEEQVAEWSKLTSRSNKKNGSLLEEIPGNVAAMASQLQRLPRHMGIHPGGMVLTRKPVSEVCPVMWAAKENRSVLQWDKEDCEDAHLVKFDLLGLGMLTALRKSFNWLSEEGVLWEGKQLDLHNIPQEDPRVYDLLCAAETVGVFQVESRAQMNTLPRLKPRTFYDIVVEVALIRPGPIQGQAVNPYLRRKNGREAVSYPHPLAKAALEKTLGVPLFQEQLMQLAVDVAGFDAGEADQLRRAIGAKDSQQRMEELRPKLFAGMADRGVPESAQKQIFTQLKGFGEFGFPESHAFSFAYLVYASAWLKVHYPEHFYAAILSSQPMGFYSPATLIEDARRHNVKVLPPSVCFSQVQTVPSKNAASTSSVPQTKGQGTLVHANPDRAVRLGLETVKGLGDAAKRVVETRKKGPFTDLSDLAHRAELSQKQVEKLALAGALEDLGIGRRQGIWSAGLVGKPAWHQPYLPGLELAPAPADLPEMSAEEKMVADYQILGASTAGHPFQFLRHRLVQKNVLPLADVGNEPANGTVTIAGVVTHRQRPSTAGGTTFLSLEDETGLANVVCPKQVWLENQKVVGQAQALVVQGRLEKGDGAFSVVAQKMWPVSLPMETRSRDFR